MTLTPGSPEAIAAEIQWNVDNVPRSIDALRAGCKCYEYCTHEGQFFDTTKCPIHGQKKEEKKDDI